MAIVRWAPFSAFTSLQREMQEMLDRFATRPVFEGFDFRPLTDVVREGDELVITAELPGIDPAELDIELEGNVLHIKGEKKVEREVDEHDRYLRECRYGSFRRDVMLPEGVDAQAIKAEYDKGVLTVRMPLPSEIVEEERKLAIPISVPEKV
jgi:HSP20 family protein